MPDKQERDADLRERVQKLEDRVQNLETVAESVRELEELTDTVRELEQRLDAQPSPDTVKWLVAQTQQGNLGGPADPEELTTLERYAQMPLAERADTIGPSDLRATLIFENWSEWAVRGPYGDEAVTTRQTTPARLRVLLREADPTVDHPESDNLHRQQVYRAMQAVHRLSDGAIRYEEQASSPDPTDRETYHALTLEAPGEMPTLPR